jgi:hypothetical protein
LFKINQGGLIVDALTVAEFYTLKSAVGLVVDDPKTPETVQDKLFSFYEFGNSIEYSLQEQRRKIAEKEASPDSLIEAMGELSGMIEEFNSVARRILRQVVKETDAEPIH